MLQNPVTQTSCLRPRMNSVLGDSIDQVDISNFSDEFKESVLNEGII